MNSLVISRSHIVDLTSRKSVGTPLPLLILFLTLKRLLPRQIGMLNNILKIIKTLERFQDLENGKTEKNGVEVTGSVLQYSLMSDCEIIPIARISAM
jgi:hypothetical protein